MAQRSQKRRIPFSEAGGAVRRDGTGTGDGCDVTPGDVRRKQTRQTRRDGMGETRRDGMHPADCDLSNAGVRLDDGSRCVPFGSENTLA